jgi:hypothetical protein
MSYFVSTCLNMHSCIPEKMEKIKVIDVINFDHQSITSLLIDRYGSIHHFLRLIESKIIDLQMAIELQL